MSNTQIIVTSEASFASKLDTEQALLPSQTSLQGSPFRHVNLPSLHLSLPPMHLYYQCVVDKSMTKILSHTAIRIQLQWDRCLHYHTHNCHCKYLFHQLFDKSRKSRIPKVEVPWSQRKRAKF